MSIHINNRADLDDSNFGKLYARYGERLLTGMLGIVKNREKAEDVAARAFRIAFEQRARFRGEASFYTWLYAIALNEARSERRSKETVSLDEFEDAVLGSSFMVSDATSKFLEGAEDDRRLQGALRRIPARYRRMLLARFIRQEAVKSIARRDGIPVGTVLSRIFKAKQLLRQAWKEVS